MREYNWDRKTITPDEIIDGLVKQYGPEQPISVEMDNRKAQIPYKGGMVTYECHRCGSVFNMTPASVLNAYYNTGYVCLKCGPLSDADLKAKQKERMNERALEELKNHGIDVFAEEEKAEEEAKEDERVALSSEDYQDAFDELAYDENARAEEARTNDENEATSESDEDDISKYMMSDDDDKTSIGETTIFDELKDDDGEDENSTLDESDEEQVEDQSRPYVDDDPEDYPDPVSLNERGEEIAEESEESIARAEAEEEKQKALEEVKAKAEQEKSEMEAKIAKVRAEMEAKMEAKMKAELDEAYAKLAKATEENEAAKKAREEAERYAAEANARAQEAEDALNAIDDDSEPSVTTEQYEEEADYDDDQTDTSDWADEETSEEDDGVEENFTLDESDEETSEEDELFDHVVAGEGYSQDEFDTNVEIHLENIRNKLGFQPWNRASFDTDAGHIIAYCRLCGQKSELNSFEDIDKIVKIDDNFRKSYNANLLGKRNNRNGAIPEMTSCKCCMESLISNGFNEYHRKTIEGLAKESHFKVIDSDKHMFIPSLNEIFTIECNDIQKEMTFAELSLLNNKDAREDPRFKVDEKLKQESTHASDNTSTVETPQRKTTVLKASAPSAENPEGSSVFNKPKEKSQHEKVSENYRRGPMVENSTDTNASLEEERAVEQEEIVKNTIFKPGQKLVLSKKNIAKLNNKQNPFEREQALEDQFRETAMARFISDLSVESEVKCNLIINNKTYELPVIDFESGLRVICADLEERSMPNVPFNTLGDPKVLPFTYYDSTATDDGTGVFKKRPKKFHWVVLFSDAVSERRDATFMALMKYINPKKLAYEGQRIQLEGNLNIEYTTYDQFLRDFDVRYSPFPGGKPKTGQLGILATWDSAAKSITTKDVLKFQLQASGMDNVANLNSLEDESSQYMVASIRYIERFNKETNRVIYTITEYVEIGSCLIADGLAQCVRALLKEYMLKYPQMRNVEPYIIVECDPNSLTSPSIKNYVKRGSIVQMNDTMRQLIYGSTFRPGRGVDQYLRYSYVRRPEYRSKDADYLRHDMRMFSVGTLIRTMSEEIKQAGIVNSIRDPDVKNRFIANMGYVKARQAEIKEMFMEQSTVTSLLYDSKTTLMRKHIEADGNMFQNTAMVTDSNSGIGINNIFTNPNLINRYQRIMERGTPEAKQHMLNLMYQSNPMMASQIQMMGGMGMMQQPTTTQPNNFGMPQMNYWFGNGNNFGN